MVAGKASVKDLQTARAVLMVLIIIILLQTVGLESARSQHSVPPQIDDEMAKQEKIYRSRGDEVPSGYVTYRGFSDYTGLLSPNFCNSLGSLGSSDRWLDIGAGNGQAILDYYAAQDSSAASKTCSGAGGKVRAVAMSIEDRRTDAWQQQASILGGDRIRYIFGKRLRQYAPGELGKFQIITDVYGGFSYTDDLSGFVQRTLDLLDVGGTFYTLIQSVRLENGKDKPNTWYLTELVDGAGNGARVCSWLKETACVNVVCDSKSEWDTPTELISIRKVCSDVSVPRMKLLKYEAGNPPGRKFELQE